MASISSTTLLERCRDAARRRSNGDAQSAIFDFGKTHCLRPIRLTQTNCLTGKPREILVPCGRCWRCRTTKRNEWITRMYSHCEAFKHVYYITLTYRSLRKDVTPDSPSWLLREYLKDALWHLDSRNSTGHLSWNPTVLCKKHYQDFMKRLRRNTGLTDITYALCGEMGHDYGRPHFHMILWTNGEITQQDIEKAWSMRYVRYNKITRERIDLFNERVTSRVWCELSHSPKAPTLSFGRVDFHDLVANGSFCDPSVQIALEPGAPVQSSQHVFGYVCKYLLKDEFNDDRVKIAWEALNRHGNSHLAWIERQMAFDSDASKALKFFRYKLHDKYRDADASLVNFYSFHNLQRIYQQNEKDSWSTQLISCKDGELRFNQVIPSDLYFDSASYVRYQFGAPQFRYPATFEGFRSVHRPFFEVSRSVPIGRLYSDAHLQEHEAGVYTRYPLQPEKSYVVPRYFNRQLEESLYPLRATSSQTELPSAIKGCLPLLRSDMEQMLDGQMPQYLHSYSAKHFSSFTPDTLKDIIRRHSLRVKGTRVLIIHHLDGEDVLGEPFYSFEAAFFEYDRSSRSFICTGITPFFDFAKVWLPCLETFLLSQKIIQNDADYKRDKFLDTVNLVNSDPALSSWEDLLSNIERNYKMQDTRFQLQYNLFHNYLD